MAKTLISSMDKPFIPEEYKDEYQLRVKELIEKKIAGQEIVAAEDKPEQGNVIDLMQAMQQSIEMTKTPKAKKKAKEA